MCKSEVFSKLVSIIAETTEINQSVILSGNREQDVIDARSLLINILNRHYNFSVKTISRELKQTTENIYYHIKHFENRLHQNNMMSIQYKIILQKEQNNSCKDSIQLLNN